MESPLDRQGALKEGNEVGIRRALVVEDVWRGQVERVLTQLGIPFDTVSDLASLEAMIQMSGNQYDVVFLDNNIPPRLPPEHSEFPTDGKEESAWCDWCNTHSQPIGYKKIQAIRARFPGIKVIGTSAEGSPNAAVDGVIDKIDLAMSDTPKRLLANALRG